MNKVVYDLLTECKLLLILVSYNKTQWTLLSSVIICLAFENSFFSRYFSLF